MANDERGGDELFEDLDKFFAPIKDVDWDEPDEPAATVPAEEHVAVRTEQSAPIQLPEDAGAPSDAGDDDAWYDTGQLEEIDEILGEPARAADETVEVIAVDDAELEDTYAADADPTVTMDALEVEEVVVRAPSAEELEAAADHFAGSLARDETYPTEPVDVFAGEPREADLLSELGADDVEEELLSDMQDASSPRTVVGGRRRHHRTKLAGARRGRGRRGDRSPRVRHRRSRCAGRLHDRGGPGGGRRRVPVGGDRPISPPSQDSWCWWPRASCSACWSSTTSGRPP